MPNKKQPKVSILVPCYNVEKYLRQCLDSIVNQTLKDIEIIAINDGSTDSTLDIIKEYAKKDKRFVIIDKPNEGYGKSMNRGLDAATGEYIGIVESDDWADENMFADLTALADKHKVDVVKSDYYEYTTTNGERNVMRHLLPSYDSNCVINPRQHTGILFCQPSIWSAVYRNKFLRDNDIRFLESPGASYQDVGFNFKAFVMANRVYLTQNAYLHYRCDNENSSVKSKSKVFCVCDEWQEINRYLSQRPDLYRATRKIIPLVKLGNYIWNYTRLCGDAQQAFAQRFGAEYAQHFENNEIQRIFYDDHTWYKLKNLAYPASLWYKFLRAFSAIIRPVYKTRVKNGWKKYYLFGFIHLRNSKKLPTVTIDA